MTPEALVLCSLMTGREITHWKDLTGIEIEACLNSWAHLVEANKPHCLCCNKIVDGSIYDRNGDYWCAWCHDTCEDGWGHTEEST